MTPMDVLIVVERFFLYWLAYSFVGWVWETRTTSMKSCAVRVARSRW